MRPVLHHADLLPSGDPADRWVWFLHGIYGAGRNWRSVARRFVEARPGWGATLVDLRLHGESEGFEPPHTLEACAEDLVELGHALGRKPAVVSGHSFGGKVALSYAERAPDELLQLWVVDSTPSRRGREGEAWRMLDALRGHPGPFASREEAVEAIIGASFGRPVARWMATNLEESEGRLTWRLDLDALEALLGDFSRTDLWSVVESPPEGVQVEVVKAEESDVLEEEDCRRVRSAARSTGRVALHRLEGGHWINMTNPEGLLQLMEERVPP